MKRILFFIFPVVLLSCNPGSSGSDKEIISVSIPPFKYFVNEISGDDIEINIVVPPGSNPHNYEPVPEQISKLSKSLAYISNGFMGFEQSWLNRFEEINKNMLRLSLGEKIVPLYSEEHHDNEGIDPHYWVSPKNAYLMAESVKNLLCTLYPEKKNEYESNYFVLNGRITELDRLADSLFSQVKGYSFMIYHPNLAYIARDYGLNEIAVEFEGKEPPPSRFRELIDIAQEKNINTIFIQKEFDKKHANSIADEINAEIVVIDPLSENWDEAVKQIIFELYKSFTKTNHTKE